MSIAITEEHAALAAAARRFLDNHCPPAVARAALEAEVGSLPPFWDEMAKLGWLGLHIDEADGGQGFGLAELAVVVEELGRARALRTHGARHRRHSPRRHDGPAPECAAGPYRGHDSRGRGVGHVQAAGCHRS